MDSLVTEWSIAAEEFLKLWSRTSMAEETAGWKAAEPRLPVGGGG